VLEKDVENLLIREIEKVGGQALKFTVPGKTGMPDRLILIPGGKVMFVEVKAPGEKPRPLQEKRMKDLEKLGFKTLVVDSYTSIENISEVVRWQNSFHTNTKTIPLKK